MSTGAKHREGHGAGETVVTLIKLYNDPNRPFKNPFFLDSWPSLVCGVVAGDDKETSVQVLTVKIGRL